MQSIKKNNMLESLETRSNKKQKKRIKIEFKPKMKRAGRRRCDGKKCDGGTAKTAILDSVS